MDELNILHQAILNGDAKTAAVASRQALSDGADLIDLVASHMIPAMDEVGKRFEREKYYVAVKARNANVVCLSALLTVTMPAMRITIDALNQAGVRDRVMIMVGGSPVTAQFAQEIGADGYSENASTAVTLARNLTAAAQPGVPVSR